jgi:hypothetical protein
METKFAVILESIMLNITKVLLDGHARRPKNITNLKRLVLNLFTKYLISQLNFWNLRGEGEVQK